MGWSEQEKTSYLEMREYTLRTQMDGLVPQACLKDQKTALDDSIDQVNTSRKQYSETVKELEAQMEHNAALRSQLVETRQRLHVATVQQKRTSGTQMFVLELALVGSICCCFGHWKHP